MKTTTPSCSQMWLGGGYYLFYYHYRKSNCYTPHGYQRNLLISISTHFVPRKHQASDVDETVNKRLKTKDNDDQDDKKKKKKRQTKTQLQK